MGRKVSKIRSFVFLKSFFEIIFIKVYRFFSLYIVFAFIKLEFEIVFIGSLIS